MLKHYETAKVLRFITEAHITLMSKNPWKNIADPKTEPVVRLECKVIEWNIKFPNPGNPIILKELVLDIENKLLKDPNTGGQYNATNHDEFVDEAIKLIVSLQI